VRRAAVGLILGILAATAWVGAHEIGCPPGFIEGEIPGLERPSVDLASIFDIDRFAAEAVRCFRVVDGVVESRPGELVIRLGEEP
jgi:hypothetical protein